MRALLCVAAIAGANYAEAAAQAAPAQALAQPSDDRLRVYDYDPNQIVSLRGHVGYQMMIEFNADERIENVSIGDSLAWQITPNRAATILFVKPVERRAATNMNVVTSRRVYSFELRAAEALNPSDPAIVYRVSFRYPAAETAQAAAPEPPPPPVFNFRYTYSGADDLVPLRVFDDGQSTYFQFPPSLDAPAIFIVEDNAEEIANAQARGEFLVVDRVARVFALRYGQKRTLVYNEGIVGAAREPSLPRRRHGWWFGRRSPS